MMPPLLVNLYILVEEIADDPLQQLAHGYE